MLYKSVKPINSQININLKTNTYTDNKRITALRKDKLYKENAGNYSKQNDTSKESSHGE